MVEDFKGAGLTSKYVSSLVFTFVSDIMIDLFLHLFRSQFIIQYDRIVKIKNRIVFNIVLIF